LSYFEIAAFGLDSNFLLRCSSHLQMRHGLDSKSAFWNTHLQD